MNSPILPLHILSFLSQLPTPRSDRSRLAELLPLWLEQLQSYGDEPALTERQWRRWRLLHAYWVEQGEHLLAHGRRRGLVSEPVVEQMEPLTTALAPPLQPRLLQASASECTALFVATFPWGEKYGECQPLELRQVLYLDRFPPLHLSARVADVAILSAGNLALEALGQWLAKRLALSEDFPIWAEAAFPDTVRLMDESASLAFVAGTLQKMLELPERERAFSGIVRRDSGRIETVQGFDLPYGKLEAAFDAGVKRLFVPQGTPLAALPQAGIMLQKSARRFDYFFADMPEDRLEIYLLGDLEDLFQAAFAASAQSEAKLAALPRAVKNLQATLPSLNRWQAFQLQLESLLPEALLFGLRHLSRLYQQASEFAQAGLSADWSAVATAWRDWLERVGLFTSMVLASWALDREDAGQKAGVLLRLQGIEAQDPAAWRTLLTLESLSVCLGEAERTRLRTLASFLKAVDGVSDTTDAVETLWNQMRFLLGHPLLEPLLSAWRFDFERLELGYCGRIVALPLLEREDEKLWCFAGMAEGQPVYLELSSGQKRVRPGAFPYLPAECLRLTRSFEPIHLHQQQRWYYGQESIQVRLSLRNMTYFALAAVQLREVLPAGLVTTDKLDWQIDLAPLQELSLTYTLQPAEAGEYGLTAPQVRYFLPAPYCQLVEETPLLPEQTLVVACYQRPLLSIRRQAPVQATCRQPFQLQLQLHNQSAQPARQLCWRAGELPELIAVRTQALLPAELGPFEQRNLDYLLEARLPGRFEWPAFQLEYRDDDNTPYTAELAGTSLEILYSRELPLPERQAVFDWLDQARQRASMLLLYGEKGLGKRQLLSAWPASRPWAEIEGDAFLNLPYQATRRLLLQLLQLEAETPVLPLAEREWLRGFAHNHLPATDEEPLKAKLFTAVLGLIGSLTPLQPLTLKIYGVERLDRPTLELLRFLYLNQASLLMLLTSEQSRLPDLLADLPKLTQVLSRLDAEEIQTLLDRHFTPHQLPQGLAEELRLRTQGLVLYLQEYLAALVEQGLLAPHPQGWELTVALRDLPIPAAFEKLILQDLQTASAELLAAATVLAQDFDRRTLQALTNEPSVQTLQAFLAQGVGRGWLQAGQNGYGFSHPLIHDLLYRQFGQQVADLHARAAQYFEQTGADKALIARHWIKAGDVNRTLDYCLQLGEQALRQGAYEAAGGWLTQAEAVLDQRPGLKKNYFRLYRWLGDLYRHTEHQQRARDAYRLYLRLAGEHDAVVDQAWAWLGLGALAQQREALSCLEQAQELALHLADDALLYQTHLQLGCHIAEARSYAEAQEQFGLALQHCLPGSAKRAEVLEQMGYEAIKAGQTQEAESILLQAKMLYESHQLLQGLASVYNRLGACCFYQQEWLRARHYFGESRKYCHQTGNQLKLAQVNHNLGLLAEALRNYSEAEQIFRENLALAVRLDDARIQGFAWNQLASVHLKLRRCKEAAEELKQAGRLLELATDQRGRAYVQLNAGLLALLGDDPLAAESVLLAARRTFDEIGDIMGQDQVGMRLGHVAWLKGDDAAAEAFYRRCLTLRQALDAKQEDGLERVYHALGLIAGVREDWLQAEDWLLKAQDLFEKRREISQYAIVCHNLSWIYRASSRLESALDYRQKRDLLIEIDRYDISRPLLLAQGLWPILD